VAARSRANLGGVRRLVLIPAILALGLLALVGFGLMDVRGSRWPVKTLRDQDRGLVRFDPVDATIAELGRLPRPAESALKGRSRVPPEETTVYRVQGRLRYTLRGLDQDIHLIVEDLEDPRRVMIAEIPLPLFALGSGFGDAFRAERVEVRRHRGGRREIVEVTGVGFFDTHLRRLEGRSSNGFELHPALSLRFLADR